MLAWRLKGWQLACCSTMEKPPPPSFTYMCSTQPPACPTTLQLHSAFPLHCLVGGGDQLYCDGVFRAGGSAALKAWGEQLEQ